MRVYISARAMPPKQKLPKQLLDVGKGDKGFREKWTKSRDLLDFPASYRAILAGPPNSGKSYLIKNILVRAKPLFAEGWIIHFGEGLSTEYDELDLQPLDEIPEPSFFEGNEKRVIVLEDLDFRALDRTQRGRLDRLFGYVSSHHNVSVLLTCQDFFSCPPCARRLANIFAIWPQADLSALATCASRTGLTKNDFASLFGDKALFPTMHNFLLVDMTEGSPAPLRVDGYRVLRRGDGAQ
jgi:hypothetical protein